MRSMLKMVLAVALLMAVATIAAAQQSGGGYVQDMALDNGSAQLDWQTGFVSATGYGAPPANAMNIAQANAMARRAATVIARRNLLEMLQGVQIDSVTTVQDAMVSSDVVVNRVRGFLQNSQILETHYLSDGSVEVVVGINMRGGLSEAILPQSIPFNPAPMETPQVAPGVEPAATASYTGLLVDARGLGARPAMSPKIMDQAGQEVYGSAMVSREYAIQQGMAGYAKDLDGAVANPRVSDRPLVVKAVAVDGKAKTNVVVDDATAAAIRKAAGGDGGFLEKCRVMIVLD